MQAEWRHYPNRVWRYRRGASLPPQYTQERRESDRLRFRKSAKSWALKHTPSALIEKDVLSFTFQKFPKFLGITHSHFIANKQTNKTVTVLKVLCLKMNIPGCPWWSNGWVRLPVQGTQVNFIQGKIPHMPQGNWAHALSYWSLHTIEPTVCTERSTLQWEACALELESSRPATPEKDRLLHKDPVQVKNV